MTKKKVIHHHKESWFTPLVFVLIFLLVLSLIGSSFLFLMMNQDKMNYEKEIGLKNSSIRSLEKNIDNLNLKISQKDYQIENQKEEIAELKALNFKLENDLENSLQAPYVSIDDQTVHMKFKRQNVLYEFETILNDGTLVNLPQDLIEWTIPFSSLESSVYNGIIMRNDLDTMNLRTDNGKKFRVVNFEPFVQPKPFENVMSDFDKEYKTDFELIDAVWNIVEQLTTYSEEIEETPKYPLETLFSGGGDCEDTAILMASLLKAVPRNYEVKLVYMDADNPLDPQEMNHVAVYVKAPLVTYIIETTTKGELYSYDEVDGWYIDV